MNKRYSIFIFTFLLILLLVGCQELDDTTLQSDAEGTSGEKVISVAQTYDIENLDPAIINSVTDGQVAWNLYDSLLFRHIETGELTGGLAKEYEVSDDGLLYTFQLHEGVQFHKGYGEMTAEDVKFTLERIIDPETKARNRQFLEPIKEIRTPDKYTVEIELKRIDPMLLDNLAQYWTGIISKKAVEEKGEKFNQDPIGTGPFVFEKWKPQTATMLVKNEDWYRGEVKVDKVRFVPIPEPSTMYLSFENGDIDIIQVSDPQRLAQYEDSEKFEIKREPGYIVRFIGINAEIEPFNDPNIRKAILYGFNRKALLENSLKNLSVPAVGPIPPNVEGYEKDVTAYPYNPEKAKELLAEAGYPDGFTTKMAIPNIDRFITPATVFQANMKEIGVNFELEIMETSTYLEKVREGAFPLFSHSKGQTAVPDLVLNSLFHSDNHAPGDNLTMYSNEDVDQWLEELGTVTDQEKRTSLLSNIQKQIAEDVPYLFIDHEEYIFATSQRVKGFIATPQRSLQLYTVEISN
ncbi:ABC transporter substrate-binding protein [Alkalihalobacillus sp. AL-G]|uniref:ABC transporter substrate-binding protein n=1 Tax=Alkalihalobacillus sp. AL-G TaxID=2926399 RepID=UPI00272B36A2|nr:ABC transporter substrate-binding protein [Alkalihalobacillus sp. AL-G]WLD94398.1 ABC transporter substrate-binding protein [Alkalihalobacillus sp. AL-G]